MELSFIPYHPETEAEALIDWLCSDEWPYHVHTQPEPDSTRERIDAFDSDADKTFWIERDGSRIGLIAVHELDDPTPVFDLRLRRSVRGQGIGVHALGWLAKWVFTSAGKHRVEGHTRADNAPMRRVFEKAGWVQEAYYRQAWPDADGVRWHDAVGCALLRSDREPA